MILSLMTIAWHVYGKNVSFPYYVTSASNLSQRGSTWYGGKKFVRQQDCNLEIEPRT